MRRRNGLVLASLWIASGAHFAWAQAPRDMETGNPACPRAEAVTDLHLYGLWQATLEGVPGTATLRLGKNANHDESVSGTLERDGQRALVAGDVDQGDFTLEESGDGKTIAATWTGRIVEASCGKEIRGTWTLDTGQVTHPFVLRKSPGWQ